jgi:hypothetical protein
LQEYGYSLVLYALHFSFQPSNQAWIVYLTAERYCDRFIILDKGKVVAFGNLEELREQTGLKEYGYSLVLYALHFSFQPSNQAWIVYLMDPNQEMVHQ